jgi:superfamily II DNA or RNA helicase
MGSGRSRAVIAPGARIQCRDAEWLVRNVQNLQGNGRLLEVVGLSPFLQEQRALFLEELEPDLKVLQPEDTDLVPDPSPNYRNSLLFLEAHLRRTVPTGAELVIGHQAAIDVMDYQLQPSAKALSMPRQRILIADAVGLGKTLECGILCSELIRRGRGRRLLVVTTRSMLGQFQKEFWGRFTIPLVRLDSAGIQRIREQLPSGQNPFHHFEKTIVSVDTLKNDREYRIYLEQAHWDIIVIDECQNVAERGTGAQKSQRARLAERLATCSDTLILLSATPHDGKPESFASLVNMLDPTAIADRSRYGPEDIRDLYVRRFRKDVIGQMRAAQGVPERDAANVERPASAQEEAVFEALSCLTLPESDRTAKAGQLFRTTLQKAMLSSPMAALETVRRRLATLPKAEGHGDHQHSGEAPSKASADAAALAPLIPLLEPIGAEAFSKYQQLLQLVRHDWGWSGADPGDRIVIFTGRRETQRFLREHLARDLGLPAEAVQHLDGGMVDTEQSEIVERFGQETDPIRVLVATEVASEGLNLHYLCHRLLHVDIPWSLMTLQQRNGRIDRYGQKRQPLIRYLLTSSQVAGMGDVERILQVLIRKDEQAQRNIGDPSVFLKAYGEEEEAAITAAAIEAGSAQAFEQQLDANAAPFEAGGSRLIAELFGELMGEASAPAEPPLPEVERARMASLYPDLWSYVVGAIRAVADKESGGGVGDRAAALQFRIYEAQQRLEITPPADLLRRYQRLPREVRPDPGHQLVLTTEVGELQAELDRSRRAKQWQRLDYLWPLHPLVEWLGDQGMATFPRHQAPVLQLSDGLAPGEVVMVLQGTIPNQSGQPVVQDWVGVRFRSTGLTLEAVEPFAAIAERLQLGRRDIPNPQIAIDNDLMTLLKGQRAVAVQAAHRYLLEQREAWIARMQPLLAEQNERLQRLRERQVQQLRQTFEADGSVLAVRAEKLRQGEVEVDKLFKNHREYVESVLTTEAAPYLKLLAVLHHPTHGG